FGLAHDRPAACEREPGPVRAPPMLFDDLVPISEQIHGLVVLLDDHRLLECDKVGGGGTEAVHENTPSGVPVGPGPVQVQGEDAHAAHDGVLAAPKRTEIGSRATMSVPCPTHFPRRRYGPPSRPRAMSART